MPKTLVTSPSLRLQHLTNFSITILYVWYPIR
jgi:hypothetical protein